MDAAPTHPPLYSADPLPATRGGYSLVIAVEGFSTERDAERALQWIMGPFADPTKTELH